LDFKKYSAVLAGLSPFPNSHVILMAAIIIIPFFKDLNTH